MYSIEPTIDKEYILSHYSQEQIMEYYLGLPKIIVGRKFNSPFRDDKNPSCSVAYSRRGKLIFKDFATDFGGDCFDVAMEKMGVSYHDALRQVAMDFNLINATGPRMPKRDYSHLEEAKAQGGITDIQVNIRKWKEVDKIYWKDRYGIGTDTLKKYGVYPVDVAWINEKVVYAAGHYPENDPCYAYRLRKGEFKLYFPLRSKDDDRTRFMSNTTKVQGFRQLPEKGKYLVMTKSMKDVMVLDTLGVPAIALASETIYPEEKLIQHLRSRFPHIISLYDFDYAGIKMANFLKRTYHIDIAMLLPDTGAKDLADYVENNGHEETRKLVEMVKGHFDVLIEERKEIALKDLFE